VQITGSTRLEALEKIKITILERVINVAEDKTWVLKGD
jgi:hypothetical protein